LPAWRAPMIRNHASMPSAAAYMYRIVWSPRDEKSILEVVANTFYGRNHAALSLKNVHSRDQHIRSVIRAPEVGGMRNTSTSQALELPGDSRNTSRVQGHREPLKSLSRDCC